MQEGLKKACSRSALTTAIIATLGTIWNSGGADHWRGTDLQGKAFSRALDVLLSTKSLVGSGHAKGVSQQLAA